jgi:hypothetical protein
MLRGMHPSGATYSAVYSATQIFYYIYAVHKNKQTKSERKPQLSISHYSLASTLFWRNTALFVCGFFPNWDFLLFFSKYLEERSNKTEMVVGGAQRPFLRVNESKNLEECA